MPSKKPVGVPDQELPMRKILMKLFSAHYRNRSFYPAGAVQPDDDIAQAIASGWAVEVEQGYAITEAGIVHWATISVQSLRGQQTALSRRIRAIAASGNAHAGVVKCRHCERAALIVDSTRGTVQTPYCELHQGEYYRRGEKSA